MSYSLKQALLLSTLREACLDIVAPNGYAIHYRFIVTLHEADDNGKNPCELKIYHVSYNKGTPVFAEKPHRTTPKESLSGMLEYLQEFSFGVEGAWHPMEPKESTEKT